MPMTITAEIHTIALASSAKKESPVRARVSPRTMVGLDVAEYLGNKSYSACFFCSR